MKKSINFLTTVIFLSLVFSCVVFLSSFEEAICSDVRSIPENYKGDFDKRTYSQMPASDSSRIVNDTIQNAKLPTMATTKWKMPESSINAQGVKINDNGWVIYAPARSEKGSINYVNASILEDSLLTLLAPDLKKPTSGNEFVGHFVLNGILISNVDLKIITHQLFKESSKVSDNVLEKGYYTWSISNPGVVWLQGNNKKNWFLVLEDPLKDFSTSRKELILKDEMPLFEMRLSPLPGGNAGILMEVPGKDIIFK
ncbi:MAG: hypothetical protein FJ240_13610 [Nitrospira sp.]|nr:hypothetical protein [Nitrospira sp.]